VKISTIFIEEQVQTHPRTKSILNKFPQTPVMTIRKVEDVFGRVKKPYLQKRDELNLFIGRKEGAVVKEAPAAYGLSGEPHYYFIHAYNCVYECEYCYLQGYFHSPDLVLYINYEEIAEEIRRLVNVVHPEQRVWFHAGEFSDSLALTHLTQEWSFFFELFSSLPSGRLELRTKSANIFPLKNMGCHPNIIISYSLSPHEIAKKYDRGAPPITSRLASLRSLTSWGYSIGIHLDPIIFFDNFLSQYQQLLSDLFTHVSVADIQYLSIGALRFSKSVYREVGRNYPTSPLLAQEFVKGLDGKVCYPQPLRRHLLESIKNICLDAGIPENRVYLCMEEEIA